MIAHRYDALAKFLKALPRLAAEEFAFLKVDARDGRLLRRLLKQDASATLPEAQQRTLAMLLARSERRLRQYAV